MNNIDVKSFKLVKPKVYGYITPEIERHNGWTKIGYTEQESVEDRVKQQCHTADVKYDIKWSGNAVFEDDYEPFTDKEFHAYLRRDGIEQESGSNNEWFKITPDDSKARFYEFRENHGVLEGSALPYDLRTEQQDAITKTCDYFMSHENSEFLWNAKPRFGKTLTTYDLCKQLSEKLIAQAEGSDDEKQMAGINKILIVTNRPAIANSWYSDYEKFIGTEDGYYFISTNDNLRGKRLVNSEYTFKMPKRIMFVSLQDLKGSIHFGGQYDKLEEVANLNWDLLVIDEAHEGIDTYKTDVAFDRIHRRFTLHLSGTPFKALANDKFPHDAIYNWTYEDEQKAKVEWNEEDGTNPYMPLPKLNLYTYKMSDIVFDQVKQGADFNDDGDAEAYAFDLNEFFKTNESGAFVHNEDVDKFLDALVNYTKFPFSTQELRDELKHTLWVLRYVSSAKALANKLKKHPVFKDYEIVLAAGDGRLNDDGNGDIYVIDSALKSYDKVRKAIKENDKTITISVGQLTTGVTIPEWTAVIMLSNMQSPALYMQAAFRAQNPCLFNVNGKQYRKQNAYVFDFDPARTLEIVEKFAVGLRPDVTEKADDSDSVKKYVRELLNFFPVYAEDDDGEMIELQAEEILSIPRSIHAKEVVRHGFMSNFLFQNISAIFAAPSKVVEILNKTEAVKDTVKVTNNTAQDLNLDENGDVNVPKSTVVGTCSDIFGEKIYSSEEIIEGIDEALKNSEEHKDPNMEMIKSNLSGMTDGIVDQVAEHYGKDMSKSIQKSLKSTIKKQADRIIEKNCEDFKIEQNKLDLERSKAIQAAKTEDEVAKVNAVFDDKCNGLQDKLKENISKAVDSIVEEAKQTTVKAIETDKKMKEKKTIEDCVRDHLRGFSRTIPSFLMAYGDGDNITLAEFDNIVPGGVFEEVTSITLDEFKFLRDGGDYVDEETGETKHFEGKLFDEIVFNDSITIFLDLKKKLSDYFDEKNIEDIFDYIPPQKTNQIFTPKNVVKMMVDMLEKENPGCFDQPDKTFIDMYMKSGLYITEIVKRLYQSKKMQELYPDREERLKHIFEEQVYGLAPTEIIYKIATSYIFGFDDTKDINQKNFKMFDVTESTKDGTLSEKLDELFDDKNVKLNNK